MKDSSPSERLVRNVPVPSFLYGTAWKEERTRGLVADALDAGFTGIDTANQRKHYHEAGVGETLKDRFKEGALDRDRVFLQTKFTYRRGQDHRLPYDPDAAPAQQVRQSFASSLDHLGVSHLDSYILHGPASGVGLTADDHEVWKVFEELFDEGKTRLIGVSNFNPGQLEELCASARIRPAFVQNRCFARSGWDRAIRTICQEHDVVYQGFSLLTANPEVLIHPRVLELAQERSATPAQIVFRFAIGVGMLPLTGTSNPQHMKQDLQSPGIGMSEDEVAEIESLIA